MKFLKGFGAWAFFISLPPVVLYFRNTPWFQKEALIVLLPLALIAALGTAILWLPFVSRYNKGGGWMVGFPLGLLLPVLLTLGYMRLYPSFENAPLFAFALIIAIPSGIGGGMAGWVQSRAVRGLISHNDNKRS